MTFGEAIETGFRRYGDFASRSCRSEYWYWALFIVVAYAFLYAFLLLGGVIGAAVALLFVVGTLIPTIGVSVRRFHDIGRSGWWTPFFYVAPVVLTLLYGFTPSWTGYVFLLSAFAVIALWLFWSLRPGEEDDNYWGANPLG